MFLLLPTRVCSRVAKTTDRSRPHFSYTSRLPPVGITYTDISEHPETLETCTFLKRVIHGYLQACLCHL
jgi:hypothetical protein